MPKTKEKVNKIIKSKKKEPKRKSFERFFTQHDVVGMAIGIILGSTLTNVTKSLTSNIINPIIGLTLGKINFSNLSFTVGQTTFRVGSLIDTILTFLIIMLVVFWIVRAFDKFTNYSDKKAPNETQLLTEILKELRIQNHDEQHVDKGTLKGVKQNSNNEYKSK